MSFVLALLKKCFISVISCFPISWLVNSLMSLLSIQNAYIKKSHIITVFVDSWIWKVGTYFWMTLFCKCHLLANGVFTYNVIFIDNSIFYIYQISVLQMSRIYVICTFNCCVFNPNIYNSWCFFVDKVQILVCIV